MYLFRFSQCMSTSSDTFNKQNCKRKKSIGLILLTIARKLRILMGLDYASRFALQLVAGLYLALRNTRNWSASSLATSTCVILRLLRPANIAQGKRHPALTIVSAGLHKQPQVICRSLGVDRN